MLLPWLCTPRNLREECAVPVKLQKNNQRKLFFRYFFAFDIVIIIPVLLFSIFFYLNILGRTREETYTSLQNGVQAIQTHFDHLMRQLEGEAAHIALQMEKSPLITQQLTTEQKMRELADCRKMLETIYSTNSSVHTLGFYFWEDQTVLSEAGYYAASQDAAHRGALSQILTSQQFNGIHLIQDQNHSIYIARCIPIVYQRAKDFFFLSLDLPEMRRQLQSAWLNGRCLLLDQENQLILSTDSADEPGQTADFPLEYGEAAGTYYAVKASGYEAWKYVLTVERSWADGTLKNTRTILAICLMVLFGLGAVLSYILARVIYRPIEQIIGVTRKQLSQIRPQALISQKDEWDFLNEALETFDGYRRALEQTLDIGRVRVLSDTLRHLMEGHRIDRDELDEIFESYSFSLPGPRYLLLTFTLDSGGLNAPNTMARYQLSQSMQAALGAECLGEVLITKLSKEQLACVISHQDEQEFPLRDTLEKAIRKIANAQGCPVKMGVSRAFHSWDDLHAPCVQALGALASLSHTGIAWAGESGQRGEDAGANGWEMAESMLPLLLAEDREGVAQEIGQFRQAVQQHPGFKPMDWQNLLLQAAGYWFGTLRERCKTLSLPFPQELPERVQRAYDADALALCLEEICGVILDAIHEEMDHRNSSRMIRAVSYINEHFQEDISLTNVADVLEITPQHLSSVFKDEMGVNFTEYVNEKRLQLACRLLRTTKESVQEIAAAVGYNSVQYFTRKFKEAYNVTPTQYREES